MQGLNSNEITSSYNIEVFPDGELNPDISKINIEQSSINILNDFDKKEILLKISNFELSKDFLNYFQEYEMIFKERNIFLYKFLGKIFKETGVTLSTVDKRYSNSITDDKLFLTMICCIY